jgi:uroporphyrinogen decarboxylase
MPLTKQDKMTVDERWVALLNRQPVDRVSIHPMALGYAGLNSGRTINDFYVDLLSGKREALDSVHWLNEQYGFDQLPFFGTVATMEFGGELKMPSGEWDQSVTIARLPVTTEEEAWSWKSPPDLKSSFVIPLAIELGKMEAERGAPFIQPLLEGPWDNACRICGIEQLCKWTVKKPDVAHHLVRLAMDYNLQFMQWWIDAFGAERLFPFSTHAHTAGQIVGPKTFEEFCFPYIKEEHEWMISKGVKHIMTHVCGHHALNYPMWAQIPMGDPGVISVAHDTDEDWPTPLESVCKLFPNDVIMGNVEPALFQIGTPEQVYELCRQCIEIGKKHEAGFVLAPGCELPPKCSPYNVWQMVKAVSNHGWYS